MIKYTIHFTAINGSEAQITGGSDAIIAIEDAFQAVGIKYNEQAECWDAGFYANAKPKNRVTRSGSVECPYCHWGFHPDVIRSHVREKH